MAHLLPDAQQVKNPCLFRIRPSGMGRLTLWVSSVIFRSIIPTNHAIGRKGGPRLHRAYQRRRPSPGFPFTHLADLWDQHPAQPYADVWQRSSPPPRPSNHRAVQIPVLVTDPPHLYGPHAPEQLNSSHWPEGHGMLLNPTMKCRPSGFPRASAASGPTGPHTTRQEIQTSPNR